MHILARIAGALFFLALIALAGCPDREWDNPFDSRGRAYVPPPEMAYVMLSLTMPDTLWAECGFRSPLSDTFQIEHYWLYEQELLLHDTLEVPLGTTVCSTYIRAREGPGTYGIELYYAGAFLGQGTIELGGWLGSRQDLPVKP
jgi:hypothetical protein